MPDISALVHYLQQISTNNVTYRRKYAIIK